MNLVGMHSLGLPELVLILVMLVPWMIAVAAAIWALVTLHRIRTTQLGMETRLQAIEQLLQRR